MRRETSNVGALVILLAAFGCDDPSAPSDRSRDCATFPLIRFLPNRYELSFTDVPPATQGATTSIPTPHLKAATATA